MHHVARKVAACPGSCHRAKAQRLIRQYRILCDAGQFTGEERNKFCGLCEGSSSVGIERMPNKRRDSRSGMVAVEGGERSAGGAFVSFKAVTIRWRSQLPRLRRSLFPPRFSAIRLLHLMPLAPICAAPAAWFNRSVHTTRLGRAVFLTRSLRSNSTWSAKATECARQRTSDQSSSGKNL